MLRCAISILLLALIAVPAAAASGPLARCAEIEDDGARLRCFDAASRESSRRAGPAVDVEPQAAAPAEARPQPPVPTDPSTRAPRAGSHEEVTPIPREASPEVERWRGSIFDRKEVSALLVDHREDPLGRWIFVLDNGQVWQQMDSSGRLRVPPNREPRVVIREQRMGGYMLKLSGNRAVQAKRVK